MHLTVVPWFRVELASGQLAGMLFVKLADVPDFFVKVEGRGGFGHRHKEAAQVNRPDELIGLEKVVRGTLKDQNAWMVDESTRLKHEFSPHVTDQKTERLEAGDEFWVHGLYIISQQGEYKQIDAEVPLGTSTTT